MRGCPLLLVLLPAGVLSIAARGPSGGVVLQFPSSRIAPNHPLHASPPAILWCAPDNYQISIQSATFIRDGKEFNAVISDNKKNATIEVSLFTDAGEYTCRLKTSYGVLTHNIGVYVRPTAITNDHLEENKDKERTLTAPQVVVSTGESANISCNVHSYPRAVFTWTKDKKPLEMSPNIEVDGNTVRISNIDQSSEGIYACEAVNEFAVGGKKTRTFLSIETRLVVRSEYAWIWPLLVIIAILVVLVITIILCEMRKKRLERQTRYVVQE